jgi:hypothetical protein
VLNKSAKKALEPDDQITVKPAIAMVKDLVTKNVEDGHIIFCEDASNVVSHPSISRKTSVPVLSIRIGDHCYYGLCDIGTSSSAIPYELYREIMHKIGSYKLEDIDVVIQLANRETISPIGIIRDVEVLCGKTKYPAVFLVLGSAASKTCPNIFGRPFLSTCGPVIDCKREKILTKFDGESYDFNFSKFTKAPYKTDLPNEHFRVEQLASIALAPNDALQQYMEDHKSEIICLHICIFSRYIKYENRCLINGEQSVPWNQRCLSAVGPQQRCCLGRRRQGPPQRFLQSVDCRATTSACRRLPRRHGPPG